MTDAKYPLEFIRRGGAPKFILAVRVMIPVDAEGNLIEGEASQVTEFMNSYELRNIVYDGRAQHGLSDYGMSNAGASHPLFADPNDRNTLIGYEREFAFTASI